MSNSSRFETVPLAEMAQRGLVTETADHRPVVLVVDDEQIIADTRAAIFRSWGYTALTAYDAESALELAKVIPPELLVTDVLLTRMNGVDLAIAIKKFVPDCKVILFSGQPGTNDMLAAAQISGHDFPLLDKPLHPAQLFTYLSKINFGPQTIAKKELNRREARNSA
jgi:DNA-binding NtrC family response regulator